MTNNDFSTLEKVLAAGGFNVSQTLALGVRSGTRAMNRLQAAGLVEFQTIKVGGPFVESFFFVTAKGCAAVNQRRAEIALRAA